jgi:4'-phosphopantetheinyl transferase
MAVHDVIDVWQVRPGPGRDAGHAALCRILHSYVGGDPAQIAFRLGPHGKPSLAGHDLQFSFSRSGEVALVAVSRHRPVGVDVERVKPGRATDRIACRRFAPDEAAALAVSGPGERDAAFHRCWTAKEAYMKGLGTGLSHGLASFSVAALGRGEGRCAVGTWEVARLEAPPGYAAAVAAPGPGWRIERMEVPGG